MNPRRPAPLRLAALRTAVDVLDDSLIVLVAARRRLIAAIAAIKTQARIAPSDPARERYVHDRALALARRLRVPAATAFAIVEALIADARRQQDLPRETRSGAASTPAVPQAPETRIPFD